MSDPNDFQSFKREVYTDAAENVSTSETLHQSDYIVSQLIEEEQLFTQRFSGRTIRSGLFIGAILVSLLGIGVLIWYLPSRSNNKPNQQIIFSGMNRLTSP